MCWNPDKQMLWESGGNKPPKWPPKSLWDLMRAHSLLKCHKGSAEWSSFKGLNQNKKDNMATHFISVNY